MQASNVIRQLLGRQLGLDLGGEEWVGEGHPKYVQYHRRFPEGKERSVHYEVHFHKETPNLLDVEIHIESETQEPLKTRLIERLKQERDVNDTPGIQIRQGGKSIFVDPSIDCADITIDKAIEAVENSLERLYHFFEPIINEVADEVTRNTDKGGENPMIDIIKGLLDSNLQVILTGAPGTGKTYTAKGVAKEVVGAKTAEDATEEQKKEAKKIEEDRIEFVQFHPGYDYSDFVIGMKPRLVGAEGNQQVTFEWKDGIFKKFADRARNDLGHKYVFLIDEINRADLSRVFGELFSLLEEEYRYEILPDGTKKNVTGITLPNGQKFVIPKNLYIIGTMNDIDRSVESMDFALRRRFAWYEVSAKESECIIDKTIVDADAAAKLKSAMDALNLKIADPDFRLGTEYQLGGAIFAKYAKHNGQDDAFEKLWKNHIEIILREYLRGRGTRGKENLKELKDIYDSKVNAQRASGGPQSPTAQ